MREDGVCHEVERGAAAAPGICYARAGSRSSGMSSPCHATGSASAIRCCRVAALVTGMVSLQCGATFAKSLFPALGAAGTSALRVGFSALILIAVWRPWRRSLPAREAAGSPSMGRPSG